MEKNPTIAALPAGRPESQPRRDFGEPLVVVAAALIDSRGRVMMQRRPEGKQHGGLWEFPGGKVEPGEGPVAALVREIAEELTIVIAPDDLHPVTFATSESATARAVVLMLYACHHWRGVPVCEAGAEVVWATATMLDELPMPPLDVPLAAALEPRLKWVPEMPLK